MYRQFNLIDVIEAAIKWYKPIAFISLVVLVGTYILTIPSLNIIPPVYESIAVIYPANLSLYDRPYLFESKSAVDLELNMFGNKDDVDRLVAIAESKQMMAHIATKFNLIQHYEIDTSETKYAFSAAIGKFMNNYKTSKNEYDAIEVVVTDKDKFLAAEMANEVVDRMDEINKNMIISSRQKILKLLSEHTEAKKVELGEINGLLAEAQGELNRKLLEAKMLMVTDQLMNYSTIMEQYKLITSEDVSTIHIMEEAAPAEKEESYRFIIIAGSFLGTLFLLLSFATIKRVYEKPIV